jgi:Ser/Thr protein kinase RdoA (MazF antagonist)
MSVFTTVTPDDMATWLQRYTLGTLTGLRGIAAGIENTNYFLDTTEGRYVLTLFEKLRAEELPFYLDLMSHLAVRGIREFTPPVTHVDAPQTTHAIQNFVALGVPDVNPFGPGDDTRTTAIEVLEIGKGM